MASGKIMIVDDDRNICELLRLYIEKEGFETAIANDGKAAVHEPGYQRSEAFFTNLADAAKGIKARMGRKMIAISILSNIHAEPFGGAAPKTGNLGIVGSFDPVAADQAACDLIWQLPSHTAQRQSIGQKIDSGWLQLEKLAAVGAGSRIYHRTVV